MLVQLTTKPGFSFWGATVSLCCAAQEVGTEKNCTNDGAQLLEEEFEAYLMNSFEVKEPDVCKTSLEASITSKNECYHKEIRKEPGVSSARSLLLRVPHSGPAGITFALKRTGATKGRTVCFTGGSFPYMPLILNS